MSDSIKVGFKTNGNCRFYCIKMDTGDCRLDFNGLLLFGIYCKICLCTKEEKILLSCKYQVFQSQKTCQSNEVGIRKWILLKIHFYSRQFTWCQNTPLELIICPVHLPGQNIFCPGQNDFCLDKKFCTKLKKYKFA